MKKKKTQVHKHQCLGTVEFEETMGGNQEYIYETVHRVHERMQSITHPARTIIFHPHRRRQENPGHSAMINNPSRAAGQQGSVVAPASSAAGCHHRRSRGSRVLPGEALHDVLEAGLVSAHLRRDDVLHLQVLLPRRRATGAGGSVRRRHRR
jgi:hypothetical protein